MCIRDRITVGNNTYKMIFIIYHRNTTDMIIMHHIKSILHCTATTDGDRVINLSLIHISVTARISIRLLIP